MLEQIIALLIQFAPEERAAALAIIKAIKDYRDKAITAQQATDAAQQALGLLLGRTANIDAEEAGENAAVDADLGKKFGQ